MPEPGESGRFELGCISSTPARASVARPRLKFPEYSTGLELQQRGKLARYGVFALRWMKKAAYGKLHAGSKPADRAEEKSERKQSVEREAETERRNFFHSFPCPRPLLTTPPIRFRRLKGCESPVTMGVLFTHNVQGVLPRRSTPGRPVSRQRSRGHNLAMRLLETFFPHVAMG